MPCCLQKKVVPFLSTVITRRAENELKRYTINGEIIDRDELHTMYSIVTKHFSLFVDTKSTV